MAYRVLVHGGMAHPSSRRRVLQANTLVAADAWSSRSGRVGGAAVGAAAGGVTGAVVGGPVGAAVGAGVGAAAGGAASEPDQKNVVIERRDSTTTGSVGCSTTTQQKTDAMGDTTTKQKTEC